MFLTKKDNLLKEYKNRVAKHKDLVIRASLIAFEDTIYDVPLLAEYKHLPYTAEEKANYILYTSSDKELKEIYNYCWDKIGKYIY